jgi:hypothetical protein
MEAICSRCCALPNRSFKPGAARAADCCRTWTNPARFVHEIEYETPEEMELNRQRIASDPRVQAWLATWRALLQGAIEVDVYQEAG